MTSIILLINCSLFLPFIYITWIKLSLFFFLASDMVKYYILDYLSYLQIEQHIQNKQTNKRM